MYCRNCGKPIPEEADFCPNCGQKNMGKILMEQSEEKPQPEPVKSIEEPVATPEPVIRSDEQPVYSAPQPQPIPVYTPSQQPEVSQPPVRKANVFQYIISFLMSAAVILAPCFYLIGVSSGGESQGITGYLVFDISGVMSEITGYFDGEAIAIIYVVLIALILAAGVLGIGLNVLLCVNKILKKNILNITNEAWVFKAVKASGITVAIVYLVMGAFLTIFINSEISYSVFTTAAYWPAVMMVILCILEAIAAKITPKQKVKTAGSATGTFKEASDRCAETVQNTIQNSRRKTDVDIPTEIKKYKELLDMGAITQEEYDAVKRNLLGL